MRSRYFTPAEANALLPEIRSQFQHIRVLVQAFREAAQQIASEEGEGTQTETLRSLPLQKVRALKDELREQVAVLTQLGVEVKDLDAGLIDFPALKEGHEVQICWKLGEERVTQWHAIGAGFAGRKPLAEVPEQAWIWYS